MYCIIIFAELLKNTEAVSALSLNLKNQSARSRSSFANSTVKINEKYGEHRTLYVNPNCRVQILLDYLYDVTGLEKKQAFDLCDVNGVLMNLRSLKEWDYATKVLDHQHTYYIILYEREEAGKLFIEPMLRRSSKTNADLIVLLKRQLGSNATISSREKEDIMEENANIQCI
ncbi:uncharacterized protein CXorf65 homolog isoform X2 [Agrilus planipennis]|uniref:Uncharacterized protein CXorf65 homolog isoform X2 n=1 Tax=Agrilus planipennis TaxID=224129 RepID=A0A1W4WJ99_AGRPL|nr:uncharacterized protein CXorf65 homolog isoform X2 [Agrilus planipennis]